MRKAVCVILALMILLMCSACSDLRMEEYSKEWYAMDTFMSVRAYTAEGSGVLDDVEEKIAALEKLWSVTDEHSEIYALNHGGSGEVSTETAELISFALDIADKSGGALDPTIYPVLTAWGFTTDNKRVPPADELSRLLELVDYKKVSVSGNTVTLGDGMMLDLGAIAKGAASDAAAEILRESGVTSALIYLGGSVMTIGGKPDGTDWRIGVQNPVGDGNIGVLELRDLAAVTSGMYERYFTAEDGTRYGHIIDPESGYPADNEILSATIISPDGTLCDALSTAVFVMGEERALQLRREMGNFDMILITKGGEVIVTPGAAERFTLTNGSPLRVRVIKE